MVFFISGLKKFINTFYYYEYNFVFYNQQKQIFDKNIKSKITTSNMKYTPKNKIQNN